jgi:hypothetical protein
MFGAICLYCGSNDNLTVGQFMGALKTIISGLAFIGLHEISSFVKVSREFIFLGSVSEKIGL